MVTESRITFSCNMAWTSLAAQLSGNRNTAHGVDALRSNFGGSNNTATGVSALDANTSGSQNTATGALALRQNTTGLDNTAQGWNALGSNTTGIRNTAVGQAAMFNGSISAEHGLGVLKRDEIKRYKSELELELMRRIEQTLDPYGLMNPGKVL